MASTLTRSGLFAARLAVTALAFFFLLRWSNHTELVSSLRRLQASTLSLSFAIMCAGIAVAVLRWRALMLAYGAARPPSAMVCLRWYLVAMFYNVLPGAVGGDVYRGYATRLAFADGAATRSIAVVFVERVMGLVGLFLLAAAATLNEPRGDLRVLLLASLGLLAAFAAIAGVAWGARLAPHLPSRVASTLATLPSLERPWLLALAVPLSVATHLAAALSGHVLIASLSSAASLGSSLVIFPLGALAAYFPFTVAGAGARDGALTFLFHEVGVASSDALTTSLTLLAYSFAFAALGGVLQLLTARATVSGPERPS